MSLSIEHSLIIKLFKVVRSTSAFQYFFRTGSFTEPERKLLNELIKQDYETSFKEAGFDKNL